MSTEQTTAATDEPIAICDVHGASCKLSDGARDYKHNAVRAPSVRRKRLTVTGKRNWSKTR